MINQLCLDQAMLVAAIGYSYTTYDLKECVCEEALVDIERWGIYTKEQAIIAQVA